MATPNPTQGTVPLRQDPAEMWDRLVAEGVDPEEATRRVSEATGAQPKRGAGLSGVLRTVAQGVTLGFGDEIEGAARALIPGGAGYREGVDAAREDVERFREEHPVGSTLLEVGGGLATGGAGLLRSAGGAAARTGLRRLAAKPLAQGVGGGAVAGAGVSEGGVSERLPGALGGAALGGALGGAVAGVGRLRGPAGRARSRLAEAMSDEGTTDVSALAAKAGPGDTVMDVGGDRVRRLARAAEAIPSEGGEGIRDFLYQRAARQPDELRGALQRRAGVEFGDGAATVRTMTKEMRERAKPLYDAAYEKSVPATTLADEVELPAFRRAYEQGREIARVEGVDVPDIFAQLDAGVPVDKLPEVPVRAIDYMKRGLDDITVGVEGGPSGQLARGLRSRLKRVLERVDDEVPEFGQARASFAGDAAIREAFEAGRGSTGNRFALKKFTTENPDEIALALEEMTPSERLAYRRGAVDDLRQKLERSVDEFNPGGRDLTKTLGKEDMQRRIRLLFDDEADFRAFQEELARLRNQYDTKGRVLGGSPTSRIDEDKAALRGLTVNDVVELLTRPLQRAGAAIGSRMAVRGGSKTANELAPLLTGEIATTQDDLGRFLSREAGRSSRLRGLSRAAGIGGGLAAGRATLSNDPEARRRLRGPRR